MKQTSQRFSYTLITAISLCLFFSANAYADMLLFSDKNTFHGCLDCSKYDTNSVCNKYGNFGSKYSSDSIWNKYGLGSQYGNDSPFNKYGDGLKVVDVSGNFYGHFSRSYNGNKKLREVLDNLWDAADGDYDMMRELFCS